MQQPIVEDEAVSEFHPVVEEKVFHSNFKSWIRVVAFIVAAVFLPEQVAQAIEYDARVLWNKPVTTNTFSPAVLKNPKLQDVPLAIKNLLKEISNKPITSIKISPTVSIELEKPANFSPQRIEEIYNWLIGKPCGAKALYDYLSYAGQNAQEQDIAVVALTADIVNGVVNPEGNPEVIKNSLFALSKASEFFGQKLFSVKLTNNNQQLTTNLTPFIAHLKGDHYILITKITEDKAYFSDNHKEEFLPKDKFLEQFSGYCLIAANKLPSAGYVLLTDKEAKTVLGAKSRRERGLEALGMVGGGLLMAGGPVAGSSLMTAVTNYGISWGAPKLLNAAGLDKSTANISGAFLAGGITAGINYGWNWKPMVSQALTRTVVAGVQEIGYRNNWDKNSFVGATFVASTIAGDFAQVSFNKALSIQFGVAKNNLRLDESRLAFTDTSANNKYTYVQGMGRVDGSSLLNVYNFQTSDLFSSKDATLKKFIGYGSEGLRYFSEDKFSKMNSENFMFARAMGSLTSSSFERFSNMIIDGGSAGDIAKGSLGIIGSSAMNGLFSQGLQYMSGEAFGLGKYTGTMLNLALTSGVYGAFSKIEGNGTRGDLMVDRLLYNRRAAVGGFFSANLGVLNKEGEIYYYKGQDGSYAATLLDFNRVAEGLPNTGWNQDNWKQYVDSNRTWKPADSDIYHALVNQYFSAINNQATGNLTGLVMNTLTGVRERKIDGEWGDVSKYAINKNRIYLNGNFVEQDMLKGKITQWNSWDSIYQATLDFKFDPGKVMILTTPADKQSMKPKEMRALLERNKGTDLLWTFTPTAFVSSGTWKEYGSFVGSGRYGSTLSPKNTSSSASAKTSGNTPETYAYVKPLNTNSLDTIFSTTTLFDGQSGIGREGVNLTPQISLRYDVLNAQALGINTPDGSVLKTHYDTKLSEADNFARYGIAIGNLRWVNQLGSGLLFDSKRNPVHGIMNAANPDEWQAASLEIAGVKFKAGEGFERGLYDDNNKVFFAEHKDGAITGTINELERIRVASKGIQLPSLRLNDVFAKVSPEISSTFIREGNPEFHFSAIAGGEYAAWHGLRDSSSLATATPLSITLSGKFGQERLVRDLGLKDWDEFKSLAKKNDLDIQQYLNDIFKKNPQLLQVFGGAGVMPEDQKLREQVISDVTQNIKRLAAAADLVLDQGSQAMRFTSDKVLLKPGTYKASIGFNLKTDNGGVQDVYSPAFTVYKSTNSNEAILDFSETQFKFHTPVTISGGKIVIHKTDLPNIGKQFNTTWKIMDALAQDSLGDKYKTLWQPINTLRSAIRIDDNTSIRLLETEITPGTTSLLDKDNEHPFSFSIVDDKDKTLLNFTPGSGVSINYRAQIGRMYPGKMGPDGNIPYTFRPWMNDSPIGISQQDFDIGSTWKGIQKKLDEIAANPGDKTIKITVDKIQEFAKAISIDDFTALQIQQKNIASGTYDAVLGISFLKPEKRFSSLVSTTLFEQYTNKPILTYSGTDLNINHDILLGRLRDGKFELAGKDALIRVNQTNIKIGEAWQGVKEGLADLAKENKDLAKTLEAIQKIDAAIFIDYNTAIQTQQKAIRAGRYDASTNLSLLTSDLKSFSSPVSTTALDRIGKPLFGYSGNGFTVNYEAKVGKMIVADLDEHGKPTYQFSDDPWIVGNPIQIKQQNIPIGEAWKEVQDSLQRIIDRHNDTYGALYNENNHNIDDPILQAATKVKEFTDIVHIASDTALQTQARQIEPGKYDAVFALNLTPLEEKNLVSPISTTLFGKDNKPMLSYTGTGMSVNYEAKIGRLIVADLDKYGQPIYDVMAEPHDYPITIDQKDINIGEAWEGVRQGLDKLSQSKELFDSTNLVKQFAEAVRIDQNAAIQTQAKSIEAGKYDAVFGINLLPIDTKNLVSPLSTTLFDNNTGKPMLSYTGTGLSINYEAQIGRMHPVALGSTFRSFINDSPIGINRQDIEIGKAWDNIKNGLAVIIGNDKNDQDLRDTASAVKAFCDQVIRIDSNAALQTQAKNIESGYYDAVLSLSLIPVSEKNFIPPISTTLFGKDNKPMLSYTGTGLSVNYEATREN
ncbi:MAG: cysteine peptidase family C39 domain-containing protein [Candidatus Omnitrophica bacterium]|nr:cysteine peptidase family C39 domain-containing protein [Candidatus Omnitrophota bacterium]